MRSALDAFFRKVLSSCFELSNAELEYSLSSSGELRLTNLALAPTVLASWVPLAASGHVGLLVIDCPWRVAFGAPISVTASAVHIRLHAKVEDADTRCSASQECSEIWNVLRAQQRALGAALFTRLTTLVASRLHVTIRDVRITLSHAAGTLSLSMRALTLEDMPTVEARSIGDEPQRGGLQSRLRKRLDIDDLALAVGEASETTAARTQESGQELRHAALAAPSRPSANAAAAGVAAAAGGDGDACRGQLLEPLSMTVAIDVSFHTILASSSVRLAARLRSPFRIALRYAHCLEVLALSDALESDTRRHRYYQCGRPSTSPLASPRLWWAYILRCARHTRGASLGSSMLGIFAGEAASDIAAGGEVVDGMAAGGELVVTAEEVDRLKAAVEQTARFPDSRAEEFMRTAVAGQAAQERQRTVNHCSSSSTSDINSGGDMDKAGGGVDAHHPPASHEWCSLAFSAAGLPISMMIYARDCTPLIEASVAGLGFAAAARTVGPSYSIAARASRVQVLDQSDEWPELRPVIVIGDPVSSAGAAETPLDAPCNPSDALFLSLDTSPADGKGMHLDATVGCVRGLFNLSLLHRLSRQCTLPAAHTAAAQRLGRSLVATWCSKGGLRLAVGTALRTGCARMRISLAGAQATLLESPRQSPLRAATMWSSGSRVEGASDGASTGAPPPFAVRMLLMRVGGCLVTSSASASPAPRSSQSQNSSAACNAHDRTAGGATGEAVSIAATSPPTPIDPLQYPDGDAPSWVITGTINEICAAVLPPMDPTAPWMQRMEADAAQVPRYRDAQGSSCGEATSPAARSWAPLPEGVEYLLSPVDARAKLSLRLAACPADVALADISFELGVMCMAVSQPTLDHLLPLVRAFRAAQLLPFGVNGDERCIRRSGWLCVTERRPSPRAAPSAEECASSPVGEPADATDALHASRASDSCLLHGRCWVELAHEELAFVTSQGARHRVQLRNLQSLQLLPGGASFVLRVLTPGNDLSSRAALVVTVLECRCATASEANRWLAACAVGQSPRSTATTTAYHRAHLIASRAGAVSSWGARLAVANSLTPTCHSSPTRQPLTIHQPQWAYSDMHRSPVACTAPRQHLVLAIALKIRELSIEISPAVYQASALPLAGTVRLRLIAPGGALEMSPAELKAAFHVQAIQVDLQVAPSPPHRGVSATSHTVDPTGAVFHERFTILEGSGDLRTDGCGAPGVAAKMDDVWLHVKFSQALPGSPHYATSVARMCVEGRSRPIRVHLSTEALRVLTTSSLPQITSKLARIGYELTTCRLVRQASRQVARWMVGNGAMQGSTAAGALCDSKPLLRSQFEVERATLALSEEAANGELATLLTVEMNEIGMCQTSCDSLHALSGGASGTTSGVHEGRAVYDAYACAWLRSIRATGRPEDEGISGPRVLVRPIHDFRGYERCERTELETKVLEEFVCAGGTPRGMVEGPQNGGGADDDACADASLEHLQEYVLLASVRTHAPEDHAISAQRVAVRLKPLQLIFDARSVAAITRAVAVAACQSTMTTPSRDVDAELQTGPAVGGPNDKRGTAAPAFETALARGHQVRPLIVLHFPWLVLPQPSCPHRALVLRPGTLCVSDALIGSLAASPAGVSAGAHAHAQPGLGPTATTKSSTPLWHAALHDLQMFVASRGTELDPVTWMPTEPGNASHGFCVDDVAAAYLLKQARPLSMSVVWHTLPLASDAERVVTCRVHVSVAQLCLNVKYTQLATLAVLHEELTSHFDGVLPPPGASLLGALLLPTSLAPAAVRGGGAATSPTTFERASSTADPTLYTRARHASIEMEITCAHDLRLRFVDDADGQIAVPMIDVKLSRLQFCAKLLAPAGSDAPTCWNGAFDEFATPRLPMSSTARLEFTMQLSNFNTVSSRWDPMLESCAVSCQVTSGAASRSPGGGVDLRLHVADPIEWNVSYALLHDAMKAVPKLTSLKAERERESIPVASAQPPAAPTQHRQCSYPVSRTSTSSPPLCAVRNQTELNLVVQATDDTHTGLRLTVPPGGLVPWSLGSSTNEGTGDGGFEDASQLAVPVRYARTSRSGRLVEAVYAGDTLLARILLARGAHVDSTDDAGISALHMAAQQKQVALASLLLRMGAAFEQLSRDESNRDEGMRALHYAARSGCVPIIEALLQRRADPFATDFMGRTPAWLAETHRHPEAHKLLFGAVHQQMRCAPGTHPFYSEPNIALCATRGDLSRMRRLLADRADPNSFFAGASALQHACAVPMPPGGSETPHLQCTVARALIDARAALNAVASTQRGNVANGTGTGGSALHCAASVGSEQMVRLLLDARADAAQRDRGGLLPIEYLPTAAARSSMRSIADDQFGPRGVKQDHSAAPHQATRQLLANALQAASLCYGWLTELSADGSEGRSVYALLLRDQMCVFMSEDLEASEQR